jgi:arabinoxylan arabinofuranohydrolase
MLPFSTPKTLSWVSLILAVFLTDNLYASDPSTERWDSPHAANPIVPGYNADPSLVQYGGHAYLYATLDPWGGRTLGCWESPDFKRWTYRVLNWPTKEACHSATAGGSMVWAPSVVRAPSGQFYMYVSIGSEVWVGSAASPLGPWHDANGGRPLIPGNFRPGFHMIDAEAFVDDDGSAYLYWGSGWEWKNGHCFVVKLKSDLVTFDGKPRDVTPGNYFEAPFLFKRHGHYYLSYSQGMTIRDTYAVHYAIGDTPFGPFTEAASSPILTTNHARNIVSPGHHAIFQRDGHTYILYHRHSVPYVPDQAYRQTCVDELHFSDDGLIQKVVPTHAGPSIVQHRAGPGIPATAQASSSLDEVHSAARVLDDNYATRWAAAVADPRPSIQLDLGAIHPFSHQEIRLEYAWKTYHFLIEISRDGQTWTTLTDYRVAGFAGSPLLIDTKVVARYLRLAFTNLEKDAPPSIFEWSVQ